MKNWLTNPFLVRILHWEYWNSAIIYAPLYPYWAWLSLKSRSFYFLTAANPAIRNGGFIMESKKDVYDLLPSHLYPDTFRFESGTTVDTVMQTISNAGISFPMIAKPDIGERGLGVKKIEDIDALREYVSNMPVPFLVQRFVSFEKEAGIFYCRPPGAVNGYISGIVNKEPVSITGDGVSTLAMLVKKNSRYALQWKQIKHLYAHKLDSIPALNEKMILIPYGNHSRGSKFTDETFRVTRKLTATIDSICKQIPEFQYGRLDVRFKSWDSLEMGVDMSIIEVNGSGSEPTHIYDPGHTIFFAWREIVKHWKTLYEISRANNKKGVPYLTWAEGQAERKEFRKIDALLSARIW